MFSSTESISGSVSSQWFYPLYHQSHPSSRDLELSSVGYSDHKNGEVPALSLAQLKTLLKKLSKLLVNVRIRNISGKNIIVDNGDTLGIFKSLKRFKQQTDDTNNSKTYCCLVNKINNK